ncbi:MAG: DegT/DnrJ/EryC1/StrS family aminotransferase [Planctomycetota bacterium]
MSETASPNVADPAAAAVPLLDLRAQYAALRDEVLPKIAEVLEGQAVCNGPACAELEQQVADYCRVDHAVSCSSGTDALLLALMGLKIGCGDEVVTSPFTFFATAGSLYRQGVRPVFCDIDPDTFNLDPRKVEDKITERTRAVMPVHLFGQMADMDTVEAVAKRHGLHVIEDAAQAIGATYRGDRAGQRSVATALSFYPTKNLGGAGDGGMVLTPDAGLAGRMRLLRNHGAGTGEARYHHLEVGGNFRMDSFNAAYLSVKLKRLDAWHDARRANAAYYDERFAGLEELQTPVIAEGCGSIYNQYVVRTPRRDDLLAHLREKNIGCAVYYPLSLHEQPCFASLGYRRGDFPESERAAEEVLALPVYPELGAAQRAYVAEAVRSFFGA